MSDTRSKLITAIAEAQRLNKIYSDKLKAIDDQLPERAAYMAQKKVVNSMFTADYYISKINYYFNIRHVGQCRHAVKYYIAKLRQLREREAANNKAKLPPISPIHAK